MYLKKTGQKMNGKQLTIVTQRPSRDDQVGWANYLHLLLWFHERKLSARSLPDMAERNPLCTQQAQSHEDRASHQTLWQYEIP
jgi:hypothetical protein